MLFEVGIQTQSLQVIVEYSKIKKKKLQDNYLSPGHYEHIGADTWSNCMELVCFLFAKGCSLDCHG